jgi:hypothetical protein
VLLKTEKKYILSRVKMEKMKIALTRLDRRREGSRSLKRV